MNKRSKGAIMTYDDIQPPRFITDNFFLFSAFTMASDAHEAVNHYRKYSNLPYIVHPVEVAETLHRWMAKDKYITHELLAAALLHDTLEDTNLTYDDIKRELGSEVADYVWWVTNPSKPSDGNRRERKRIDNEHLFNAPRAPQTLKSSDIFCNVKSYAVNDLEYAITVYIPEKLEQLSYLTKVNKRIRHEVRNYLKEVNEA